MEEILSGRSLGIAFVSFGKISGGSWVLTRVAVFLRDDFKQAISVNAADVLWAAVKDLWIANLGAGNFDGLASAFLMVIPLNVIMESLAVHNQTSGRQGLADGAAFGARNGTRRNLKHGLRGGDARGAFL